eukprot:GFKZ01014992.1.p2 GENE.GFKZ01014992.1~~GFKZ01014992.1.p2  ORF type:complete len:177 (+),score=18.87 GFKZ01014992.1:417-947(+)
MKSFTLLTLLLFTFLTLVTLSPALPFTSTRQGDETETETDDELLESPSVEPEESPVAGDEDPICVETAYLARLGHPPTNLVHRRSILANAFCPPAALPCGTRHHRLRLNGRDLSYEQYCQQVVCTRKLVEVNSVWSHLWQDRHVDGVVLTMMDHRYPEMPQKLLHRAMSAVRTVVG